MMHKAWSSIEKVPYIFSMSSAKFQRHTGWKTNDLALIWAFSVGNSNCRMAMKWHISILGQGRGSIVFQGQLSSVNVTTDRPKSWRFGSNLGKIIRSAAAIKSLRFALFISDLHFKLMMTPRSATNLETDPVHGLWCRGWDTCLLYGGVHRFIVLHDDVIK